jgi:hypothetical protein
MRASASPLRRAAVVPNRGRSGPNSSQQRRHAGWTDGQPMMFTHGFGCAEHVAIRRLCSATRSAPCSSCSHRHARWETGHGMVDSISSARPFHSARRPPVRVRHIPSRLWVSPTRLRRETPGDVNRRGDPRLGRRRTALPEDNPRAYVRRRGRLQSARRDRLRPIDTDSARSRSAVKGSDRSAAHDAGVSTWTVLEGSVVHPSGLLTRWR